MPTNRSDWQWQQMQRARIAVARAANEPCVRCHGPIDYDLHYNSKMAATVDHLAPVGLGGALTPTDPALLAPAHRRCNASHGATLGNRIRGARRAAGGGGEGGGVPVQVEKHRRRSDQFLVGDLPSPARMVRSPRSPTDRPDWLPDVPVPPSVESPSHPDAVGSYGPGFVNWCVNVYGETPRPWQAYCAARILEHDADGVLVHRLVGVTVPRQVGKSVLLRMLALWRIHQAGLFGELQTVLHVANRLSTCEEVFLPGLQWAKEHGLETREANGQMRVDVEGSRWLPRSTSTGYGFTLSTALVDEAWDVSPRSVNSGYVPTLAERRSGQVVLFSTANQSATRLVPAFREAAMVRRGWLLLEWSSQSGDIADEREWQSATPVPITASRRALMGDGLASDPVTFGFEWLNRWQEPDGAERWLPKAATTGTVGKVGGAPSHAICGVEVTPDGRRWAVAAAWAHGKGDQVRARVWLLSSPGEVQMVVGGRKVWAHPAVVRHPMLRWAQVDQVNVSIGRAATTELRDAVLNGHLTVEGLPDSQWQVVRTAPADGGETIYAPKSDGDVHGLKALSWGVWAVQSDRHRMGLVL